jgi:RND superfamily putative drug exporter
MEREMNTGAIALKREPWTVRVAVWSARHRWPVLVGWFLLTIGLMFASAALGGQRAQSIMDKGKTIGDSQTGWNAFSDASTKSDVSTEWFYLIVENPSGKLDTTANRQAIADMTKRLTGLTVAIGGKQVPAFYADPKGKLPPVVDPFVLATAAPDQAASVLSVDGTTAIVTAHVSGDDTEATAKADAIKPLADQFKKDYPNLAIYAFNNRLINADFGDYINKSLDGLLLPTLLITFLILLVASRSAIAAFVPIVLALSAIVGAMGLVGIYSQVVSPISQYAVQIVVLIGLAVAVDYSLFVISRFRTERLAGRDKFGAIEVASSTASRAVFFSGLAVMISLGALLLIDDDMFKSIAIGAISVVLISVVGSLTFLPAVLSILDRKVMRFGIPFLSRERGEGRGIWATIVRVATNRAVIAAVAAGAVLLLVAAPVSKLQLGSTTSDPSTLPHSIEGIRAWDLITTKWPAGRNLTMDVIVTNAKEPKTAAAISTFEAAMKSGKIAGVNAATTTIDYSGNGVVVDVHAGIPGGANDAVNWDLTRTFRTSVVPTYFGSLTGTHVYVSGDAADRDPLRPGYELPAPARGFPFHRHRYQGDHPQPALSRRRLRRPGAAFPGGLAQGLHRNTPERHRGLGTGHDLHDPVRPLDGLPRLHPDPGQGSPRPRPRVHRRGGQGNHDHCRHCHQRRRDHGLRLRRLLHHPAGDHAGAGHRAGRGHPHRRHGRAQPVAAVAHEAAW